MTTFSERLKEHLAQTPGKTIITLQFAGKDDVSISYQNLLKGAQGFADKLESDGIEPGEVVVFILQHSEELVYAYFGAVIHGAIPSLMPFLTEKLPPERYRADLTTLVSITKPSVIVTYSEFEREVNSALKEGSSVRKVLLADSIDPQEIDFSRWRGLARKPEEVALLQHSSGTTGLQKGVALSHRAIFNQLDNYRQAIELTEEDVIISWLPLYHDMGLIATFLMPVLYGVHLVLSSPFDWVRAPYRMMQAVSQYKGTISWIPNFAFNFCAQKIRDRHLEGVNLSTWRAVINCSESVRHASNEAFYEKFISYGLPNNAIQASYGMAENVFAATQSRMNSKPKVEKIDREAFMRDRIAREPGEGAAMTVISSGVAIPNVQLKIVDAEGKTLPDRSVGEIAVYSNCLMDGYFNRPELTATAFLDGWYLSGDYGFISNGEVFVAGRKKDMIIVGGKNVYPQDLESLSYEVPGVHGGRSVAFGVFNEEQGTEEAALIVEADTTDEVERQKIADAIREHVTKNSAVALRYVKIVDSKWVIKTSSGKTARSANKEKFLSEIKTEK